MRIKQIFAKCWFFANSHQDRRIVNPDVKMLESARSFFPYLSDRSSLQMIMRRLVGEGIVKRGKRPGGGSERHGPGVRTLRRNQNSAGTYISFSGAGTRESQEATRRA